MKIKRIIISSLFLLILFIIALGVSAVGTNGVNLITPVNGTWWNNALNYTPGFTFNWTDVGDSSYLTASCSLYISNTSNTSKFVNSSSLYRNITVERNATNNITMNGPFAFLDTTYFYTIECCNETATPNCWFPTPLEIYLDNNTIPTLNISSTNFVNNSWGSNSSITFTFNVTDLGDLRGKVNCLQNNATNETDANSCGTFYNVLGAYAFNSTWLDDFTNINAYDDNFSTYAEFNVSDSNLSVIFVNYTKPAKTYLKGKWLIKSGNQIQRNLTLTDGCWNSDKIILKMESLKDFSSNEKSKYYCYDNSISIPAWTLLYTDNDNARIYEEAMWWFVDYGWTRGNLTVEILNASNDVVFATVDVSNNTQADLTFVAADGNYTFNIRVSDPANNTNTSGPYVIFLDSTIPLVEFSNPTPPNDTFRSDNYVFINVTINETNFGEAILNFDGSDKKMVGFSDSDDVSDANTGQTLAFDGDFSTYVGSNISQGSIFENYSSTINTNFQSLTKIEYKFQFNLTQPTFTNSSAKIEVYFYNNSNAIWVLVYSNNTNSSGKPVNVTVTINNSDESTFANVSLPFQIRINVSNNETFGNDSSKFYEGTSRFFFNRCVGNITGRHCFYNVTAILDKKNIQYNVTVNDSSANIGTTSTRFVSIDTTAPVAPIVYNWTFTDSAASIKMTTNDTSPDTAKVKVYDRDNVIKATIDLTIVSSESVVNGDNNFSGTLLDSNIITEGSFTLEFNITDVLNNSNTNNMTGIFTRLYDGWNLIGFSGANASGTPKEVHELCADLANCTQVSVFNNTNKTFKTFSTTTPSVNNDSRLHIGKGVHIFIDTSSYLISKDERPVPGETGEFVELLTQGWNTIGLIKGSDITGIWNATNITTTVAPLNYTSWYNASATTFYTCRKTIDLCSGISTAPRNINLVEGWAVWGLSVNYNASVNKSTMV